MYKKPPQTTAVVLCLENILNNIEKTLQCITKQLMSYNIWELCCLEHFRWRTTGIILKDKCNMTRRESSTPLHHRRCLDRTLHPHLVESVSNRPHIGMSQVLISAWDQLSQMSSPRCGCCFETNRTGDMMANGVPAGSAGHEGSNPARR